VKKYVIMAAVLVIAAAAWAQAPGPGATPTQGFTVETLISQISLYLPEESTQGLGGFGRGGGQEGGQQAAGQQGSAQQNTARQNFRQLFQFTRDPKLFLTKDQIAKLVPIFQALRQNPLPTPSKAKQVQSDVDATLSVAQKAEYKQYQEQMQKAFEEIRKQFAASSSGTGSGQTGTGGTMSGNAQGQASGGQGQTRQGTQLTPTERRQRELDAFIKVLQDRQKQLGS
jgi:hypothetical protein